MSARALQMATKYQVQTLLHLDDASCDIMFDGQPKPGCGEQFIAIHEGDWGAGSHGDADLEEVFGVSVTLTRRVTYAPQDQRGTEVLQKIVTGMNAVLRQLLVLLHRNWAMLTDLTNANSANAIINAEAGAARAGFYCPLSFTGASQVMEKGNDWFCAWDPDIREQHPAMPGLARSLFFGGAKRCQGITPQGASTYDLS